MKLRRLSNVGMVKPAVIVFELRPRWVPELERQFLAADVSIRGCRATADIPGLLHNNPNAALILDLESAAADCLQWLGRMSEVWPGVPVIVLASQRNSELEWPVRELGAVEFLAGTVAGDTLARVCRKQWI